MAVATATLVAGIGGAARQGSGAMAAPADRPNILVILTDDQRAHSLKYLPKTRKWFANDGRTYKHAFATTPLCCPSRSSIFTGLYAHNHGVETNTEAEDLDQETTLHAKLQDAGYQTYIAGKFLNGWHLQNDPPHFDDWTIFGDDTGPDGYFDENWNVSGDVIIGREGYTTNVIGRDARHFLADSEANDDKPWLMYVFFFAPHAHYTPAHKYADAPVSKWDGNPAIFEDKSDKPPWVQNKTAGLKRGRETRRGQIRTLMSVDDQVDDFMEALGNRGERRDTLAFFTSDNGIHWSEHGLYQKNYPYMQSIEVPLVMRWPGHVDPKVSSTDIAANIDLAPTALEAAGEDPSDLDGKPLTSPTGRDRILLEGWNSESRPSPPDWAATYKPGYEFVEYFNESDVPIYEEYYNLENDPWQLTNLYQDGNEFNNPPKAPLLEQLLDDMDCAGADCPWAITERLRRRGLRGPLWVRIRLRRLPSSPRSRPRSGRVTEASS
jgi:arylsulfatase A-like enzyme